MADSFVQDTYNSPDNAAVDFMQNRDSMAYEEELNWLSGGTDINAVEQEIPEDEEQDDPLGVRLVRGAGAVASDVGRGVTEIPRAVVGGTRDAVQEALDSVGSALNTAARAVAGENPDENKLYQALNQIDVNLPEVDDPESVTGKGIKGITQFLVGFIPALRAAKLATGGKLAANTIGRYSQVAGAGAAADAFVFDPHEERLSNFLRDNLGFNDPVTKFLAADPNDSEAMGRFKNALEGLGLGIFTDTFATVVSAIRANRIKKGIVTKADGKTETPKVVDEPLPTVLGNNTDPIVAKEGLDNVALKKIKPEELGQYVNFARMSDSDFIEKTVDQYARAVKIANDGKTLDEIVSERLNSDRRLRAAANDVVNTNGRVGFKRLQRGKERVADKVAQDIKKAHIQLTEEDIAEVAAKLQVTPEQFKSTYNGLRDTKSIQRERIVAVKMFLDDVDKKVKDLAQQASVSTDEAVLFDFQKMLNLHQAVYTYYRGDASAAGLALREFKNPSGSRAKQIEMMHEHFMRDGGPNQLRKMAKAVNELDIKDVDKILNPSVIRKIGDSLVELLYFNLLSGPKTHLANMASTAIMSAWQIPERYLAASLAKMRGADDSVQFGEASAMMYGAINSAGSALRAAAKTLKTGEQSDLFLNKVDRRRLPAISAANYGISGAPGSFADYFGKFVDGTGALIRAPTRLIMSEDEYFRVVAKNMEMSALSFRQATSEGLQGEELAARIDELMRNPSDEMIDSAQEMVQSVTFSTPLGELGKSIQNFTNRFPPAKLILPFIRTPINLLKSAAYRTPLGLLSGKVRADIAKGGAARDLAIARMALGSMVALTVMDQVWAGNVTGAGPGDRNLQANWRLKYQPYSVRLPTPMVEFANQLLTRGAAGASGLALQTQPAGDGYTWVSYNRLDPFGIVVGAAASFAEVASSLDDKDADQLALDISVATSRSVFNKTWMQGPTEFLEAMTQPDRYAEGWIEKAVSSFLVPGSSLVGTVTTEMDPVWRDVNGALDAWKSRVPTLSETLPPRRNLWGEPIYFQGALGPDSVSPVYTMEERDDPITDYIIENQVGVGLPTNTQLGIELTPEEYSEFVERSGRAAKEQLDRIIAGNDSLSGQWITGTDGPEGSRASLIKRVLQIHREQAKIAMSRENPDLSDRVFRERNRKRQLFTGRP